MVGAADVSPAQEEPTDEGAIPMILGLLGAPDREMRAIALDCVRDEIPGEAATLRFVEQLPQLPSQNQAELIQALSRRGDPAALPGVMKLVDSPDALVGEAAIRAIAGLGSAQEVPLLIRTLASPQDSCRSAAQFSLTQLKGDDVDAEIVTALPAADPSVKPALLSILAARNATSALPEVLNCAGDQDQAVRIAAAQALRRLADASQAVAIVQILKNSRNADERYAAELALLAVCGRGGPQCVSALVGGMRDASPQVKTVLLRALARAGGEAALQEIVNRTNDADADVGDEAVRMLAAWPDRVAIDPLMISVYGETGSRRRALAIRGVVRLARASEDRPADMETLAELWKAGQQDHERRLMLGALSDVGTMQAWGLAKQALETPAVFEEACLALARIAKALPEAQAKVAKPTLETIVKSSRIENTREQAQDLLDTMQE